MEEARDFPAPPTDDELVAIVGIGCRLPNGIRSREDLWRVVVGKVDCIREIPSTRWDHRNIHSRDALKSRGKVICTEAGIVEDIDRFDASFFGLSFVEAARTDPQQRLVLETSYCAFEDAGIRMEDISGTRMGVFVGVMNHDYEIMALSPTERRNLTGASATGTGTSIIANRVSYFFNLKGPSLVVDTACSSSMVAMHYACHSLRRGECSAALVGGVSAILKPEMMMAMSSGAFLSPDARCRSFDKSANGYARSEGCGVIIVKVCLCRGRQRVWLIPTTVSAQLLRDAIRDRDTIYACVRATALNQDGRSNGVTMPNEDSQRKLIVEAYKRAGVPMSYVDFIEAHGTGTPTGDPIEGRAIAETVGKERGSRETPLYIGSVKSNIGHSESASGVVGLIKLALSLYHQAIPPNLHFVEPNPKIPWKERHMIVPRKLMEWPEPRNPMRVRIGGVNSFGFGGSNAHAVLQEAPPALVQTLTRTIERTTECFLADESPVILTASAKNEPALRVYAERLIELLSSTESLAYPLSSFACSAALSRSHFVHRLGVVTSTRIQALQKLQCFLNGDGAPGLEYGRIVGSADAASTEIREAGQPPAKEKRFAGGCAFVFSGMGPQWWAMGRTLYQEDKGFRGIVEEIERFLLELQAETDEPGIERWLLCEEMFCKTEASASRLSMTRYAQPAIFALQAGLLDVWRRLGVRPVVVLGHSVGEIASMYASGILSLRDATAVIYHRSRLQARCAGLGVMLAVGAPYETALELVQELDAEHVVSVAAKNSPKGVTLTGDKEKLERIAALCSERDIFNRMLRVEVPFHSFHMAAIEDDLVASLASQQPRALPVCPVASTVTGQLVQDGGTIDGSYWYRNVREPVEFQAAIQMLMKEGIRVFVEVGPHPVLETSIHEIWELEKKMGIRLNGDHPIVVSSLRRNEPERLLLMSSLARLYVDGETPIDFVKHFAGISPRRCGELIRMPEYPFIRERFWMESPEGESYRLSASPHPHLGSKLGTSASIREADSVVYKLSINVFEDPWLLDHKVQGPVVYPAAGHVDLAVTAGKLTFGDDFRSVEEIQLHKAMFMPEEGNPPEMQLEIAARSRRFSIFSRQGGAMTLCSEGRLRCEAPGVEDASAAGDWNSDVERLGLNLVVAEKAKAECTVAPVGGFDRIRAALEAHGLELGPTFGAVHSLFTNTARSASYGIVVVPEVLRWRQKSYAIHPAVLDSAFQTFNACFGDSIEFHGLFVPVTVKRVVCLTANASPAVVFVAGRIVSRSLEQIAVDLTLWMVEGTAGQEKDIMVDGSAQTKMRPLIHFESLVVQFLAGSGGKASELADAMDEVHYDTTWRHAPLARDPYEAVPESIPFDHPDCAAAVGRRIAELQSSPR